MIDTREELVGALHEAAEIEHGLMIQYLFPALSMKKRLDEGVTAPQLAAARRWEGTILGVAVEEMGHLGTVCNLLSAVGEGPRFQRPNFPQRVGYYPFEFDLIGFGDEALYRMLVFELPRGLPLPDPPHLAAARPQDGALGAEAFAIAPEPLEYDYVGELYAKIRDGFATVPEAQLFIGPPQAQVEDTWSVALDLRVVTDRASALAAVDDIILDGEGAPAGRESSHYGRFLAIRTEYAAAGRFAAARPVARNPQTRTLRDAGPGTLLTHPTGLRVAELFDHVYGTTLLVLQQFFAFGGESGPQRAVLKATAGHLMSTAVRPLAEVLTELPAADAADGTRAAPPFELYDAVSVSPYPSARWTILLERLAAFTREATELGAQVPRVADIGETVSFVRRRVAQVAS